MKAFLTIFNALPAIVQSVQVIESAVPVPNAGKQKLDLILQSAMAAWGASQIQQQVSQNQMLNSITAITNLTVATLNATGVFQKRDAAPVSSK